MIPFAPNNSTNPMPCEMEGISIGKVTKTVNCSRKGILLRTTQRAKPHASIIEINVAVLAAKIEFVSDSLNLGKRKTPEMSEAAMFISIAARGQITVKTRKIPIRSLTRSER